MSVNLIEFSPAAYRRLVNQLLHYPLVSNLRWLVPASRQDRRHMPPG